VADIFDKCVRFLRESRIVDGEDRATAEDVLYRRSPLNNIGPWMEVDGRRVLQFSTNDYLGLASHFKLRRAATKIVFQNGVGAPMGSRALTGNIDLHMKLQKQVADFKMTEDSLVFCNGAMAMMGTIAALASARDLLIMDRYAHASLVCGARISGARIRFFRHNDMESLEAILLEAPASQAKMVVVDGVYSMHGDLAPLPEICDLCEKHGARLLVDDAHGTGVFGEHGRGVAEYFGVEDRIDLHLGTFSKAVGTIGGFVAADAAVINFLKFSAPTILFTKAMPGCVAAATVESLKLISRGKGRRKKLWRNAHALQNGLREIGYRIGNTQSPITPIEGDGTNALYLGKALFEKYHVWASAVLYPAVPIGTSILRVIPTARHTLGDIRYFLKSLESLKQEKWQVVESASSSAA